MTRALEHFNLARESRGSDVTPRRARLEEMTEQAPRCSPYTR
ncbi:MAG: hypothetical protein U0235_31230 [Polyangiaceae bacterium]